MEEHQVLRLVALIMVAFLVLPGVLYYARRSSRQALLRSIALWLAIAFGASILYTLLGPL
ncbi:hypothetical protein [Sneathiella chinensis]|uniref:Cardiolipin synthase N-terminal domain-containing protein n=1 Tax=Sneathiella chinensis TaxID=349750 RepID=A0ABQ5U648_9PROT|nr:hypothetical protein [Sneathiella chinensis]GLQ07597.1 hypothetical protein GCM10007924_28180 [Sneathiella chinensis]